MTTLSDQAALAALDARIKALLPEEYQDCYEDVQPVSMGSAGLKFDSDGKVAWNDMWATFCDLAMAGGPPHKGTLLEPASRVETEAQPDAHRRVVDEICRGVRLVTGLSAEPSPTPGWVRVHCLSEAMAGWLMRAIVMENISARCDGPALDLPAGPGYRVEKEIKNVITVIAKTCHYWTGHMWRAQKRAIADLFTNMMADSPLVAPAFSRDGVVDGSHQRVSAAMAATIERDTGLRASSPHYAGWLGLECASVPTAVWMMRALVASNILARREGTVLFVAVDPASDPAGEIVARAVTRIFGLAERRPSGLTP